MLVGCSSSERATTISQESRWSLTKRIFRYAQRKRKGVQEDITAAEGGEELINSVVVLLLLQQPLCLHSPVWNIRSSYWTHSLPKIQRSAPEASSVPPQNMCVVRFNVRAITIKTFLSRWWTRAREPEGNLIRMGMAQTYFWGNLRPPLLIGAIHHYHRVCWFFRHSRILQSPVQSADLRM